MSEIVSILAREILDSRGHPTIEVDVRLDDGSTGRAAVPAGASTGRNEAVELRDGEPRYGGKGVQRAVAGVGEVISPALCGMDASEQAGVDHRLRDLDGTPDKHRLGANAILGVSLAVARAASSSSGVPLYRSLGGERATTLPVPMFNVLNGGAHADNSVDFQEFMVAPVGARTFSEALRMGSEIYHALKLILKGRGHATAVGDEGGFAPGLAANSEAPEVLLEAIEMAGLGAGKDVVLALDPAASQFFEGDTYVFGKSDLTRHSPEDLVSYWEDWARRFPIWSLEDGMAEDDGGGWKLLTERMGEKIQLVGDDNFVTNPSIIRRAIADGVANAALIKLNQIGTLTETLEAIAAAREGGYGIVVSHRSGETPDDFIADFAVAVGAGQIKTGAPCRGERVAKYNQLLRIEEELGGDARFAGTTFSRSGSFLYD